MESTCNVPPRSLWSRREYLHDFEQGRGEYERCYWFAVHSWRGRALDCIVHTEHGCVRDQLPVSALCTKQHEEHIPLEHLQLWNSFSTNVTAIEYEYLSGLPVLAMLKDGSEHEGEYLFSVEWFGDRPSESPGDEGRKAGHVIALGCGCVAVQPNNRLIFYESSFATKAHRTFAEARDAGYRVNTREWRSERSAKWVSEDSSQFYYKLIDNERAGRDQVGPRSADPLGALRHTREVGPRPLSTNGANHDDP